MATIEYPPRGRASRSFYFFMAAGFALAAIIGFAPNSIAILAGEKANPPLIIHVHAAAMSAWLALLVAQAGLASQGRIDWHMRAGKAAFILAPIVLILMLLIALPAFVSADAPLAVKLLQGKRLVFFVGCVGAALWLRRTAPEAHKRLMFVGTFAVLDAAFFRMGFLPSFGMEQFVTIGHVWMLVLLVPFLLHDLGRLGRMHRVWLITLPPLIALEVLAAFSW